MPHPLVIPDLAGKTVLITGGSTASARRSPAPSPSRAQASPSATIRAPNQAQALAGEIKAAGGEALAVDGDVADPKACDRIVAETAARFGRLDGLINNAGLMLGRVALDRGQRRARCRR